MTSQFRVGQVTHPWQAPPRCTSMWLTRTTTCLGPRWTGWTCVCLTSRPTSRPSTRMEARSAGRSFTSCWGMLQENGDWIPHMVENSYVVKKQFIGHRHHISLLIYSWQGTQLAWWRSLVCMQTCTPSDSRSATCRGNLAFTTSLWVCVTALSNLIATTADKLQQKLPLVRLVSWLLHWLSSWVWNWIIQHDIYFIFTEHS